MSYLVKVFEGSDVKEYRVVTYDEVILLMHRIRVYTSVLSKVYLQQLNTGRVFSWDWNTYSWKPVGGSEMARVYANLFEESFWEGHPIWIFIKSYQRADAMEKFIKQRNKKTYVCEVYSNFAVETIPAKWETTGVADVYESGIKTGTEKMESRPLYRRGELIGWTKERVEKFADGWTAQGGKEAILWAVPTIIDDLETEILDLREQLRILKGGVIVPAKRKVVEDEYSFEV